MSPYLRFPATALLVFALSSGARASVIQLSGTLLPDDTVIDAPNLETNDALFTTRRSSGTSWQIEADGSGGSSIKMTTAPFKSIWFGTSVNNFGDDSSFLLSRSNMGNSLTLRSRLGDGAKSWETYFYDRDGYQAYLTFDYIENGNNRPGVWGRFADDWLDLTPVGLDLQAHNIFTSHVFQGTVAYIINGETIAVGPAFQTTNTITHGLTVIGDGSGSSPTGLGSFYIDSLLLDNAAGEIDEGIGGIGLIPEPGAVPFWVGLGLLGFVIRRRR